MEERVLLCGFDGSFADVVIWGTESVDLKSDVAVTSGDVVVGHGTITGDKDTELKIGEGATTSAQSNLVADDVEIKPGAVAGVGATGAGAPNEAELFFNNLKNNGTNNLVEHTPLCEINLARLPTFVPGIPGTIDVTVPPGDTATLNTDDDLGDIFVKDGATLTFNFTGNADNTLSVNSVKLGIGSNLFVDGMGNVTLLVKEDVQSGDHSTIGPAAGSGLDASNILVYVAHGTGNPSLGGVSIGLNNHIAANIIADPHANTKLTIGDGTHAAGAFVAKRVVVGERTTVIHVSLSGEDTEPPTVFMTNPADGSIVNEGEGILVTAHAEDNVGVTRVDFYLDGHFIGSDDAAPYEIPATVPSLADIAPNSTFAITAEAHDAAGNSASATVTLNVADVTPPVIDAGLKFDTGTFNDDGITNAYTIIGTLTDSSTIVRFDAGLDVLPNFDVLGVLEPIGRDYRFDLDELLVNQVAGTGVPDGSHTLSLEAEDDSGNTAQLELPFYKDTTQPTFILSVDSDEPDANPSTLERIGVAYTDDHSMDNSAFDVSNYYLTKSTGEDVPIAEVSELAPNLAQVTLQEPLGAGTFTFQVGGAISDVAGNPVADPKVTSFSTSVPDVNPKVDSDANDSSGAVGADFSTTFIEAGSGEPGTGPVAVVDTDITISVGGTFAGDVNGDGVVDDGDVDAVAGCLDEPAACNPAADLKGDGTIDIEDLGIVYANLGATSGSGNIESGTITLTDPQDGSDEKLEVSGSLPVGIVVDAASTETQIILTGTASAADYETAIRQVQYNNTSDSPDATDRTVTVVVSDVSSDSNVATTTVGVTATDDAPAAGDDSVEAIGNVSIDVPGTKLTENDTDPEGSPLSVAWCDATSAAGGAVEMNSAGGCTYDPPAGFQGTDTFRYMTSDPEGLTGLATVTVTVRDLIWFVDNSSAGKNLGTLLHPFRSIAAFNGSLLVLPGHHVYVEETGADYPEGIVLPDRATLVGKGATGTLAGRLGIFVPPYSRGLPLLNSARPWIKHVGGNALILGCGNQVYGVNFGDAAGAGIFGRNVCDLVIDEVGVGNTIGGGVDVSGGTDVQVNLDEVTSAAGDGLRIEDNTGSSRFSIVKLALITSGGCGICARNSGTVIVSDGTIDAGTGVAVDIESTALGIALRSVRASGGLLPGIRLIKTPGYFRLLGDGTGEANSSAGFVVNVSGNAIELDNAENVEIYSLTVDNTGGAGIWATNLRGTNILRGLNVLGTVGRALRILTEHGQGRYEIRDSLFDRPFPSDIPLVSVEAVGDADADLHMENNSFSSGVFVNPLVIVTTRDLAKLRVIALGNVLQQFGATPSLLAFADPNTQLCFDFNGDGAATTRNAANFPILVRRTPGSVFVVRGLTGPSPAAIVVDLIQTNNDTPAVADDAGGLFETWETGGCDAPPPSAPLETATSVVIETTVVSSAVVDASFVQTEANRDGQDQLFDDDALADAGASPATAASEVAPLVFAVPPDARADATALDGLDDELLDALAADPVWQEGEPLEPVFAGVEAAW